MRDVKKLGLGTVQWGLNYGVANETGAVSSETVKSILNESKKNGIKVLDTAADYGHSERILGKNDLKEFTIVTKIPKLSVSRITSKEIKYLQSAFLESLKKLSSKRIYGLLVHHIDDILVSGGEEIISVMKEFQAKGQVEKIGISVYNSEQVDEVMKIFKPDLIQLPLNVLDQRMILSGHLKMLKENDIEIHVRSVFLQGLLLMPVEKIPEYFEPIKPLLRQWHKTTKDQGLTPTQAALSFVKSIPYIDKVIIGVDSLAHFSSCIKDFSIEAEFNPKGLVCNDPLYVDPSLWKI